MFFGIDKIQLDGQVTEGSELRPYKVICQKIRQRFAVICSFRTKDNQIEIVLSCFAQSEQQIDQKFDQVSAFIEQAGVGRVLNEACMIDHIDQLIQE